MRATRKKNAVIFGNLKEENFNFQQIEGYFRNNKHQDVLQILSDRTCDDLDFQELFMFVDRTVSKVGQQYLFSQMRSVPTNLDQWNYKEKIINAFTEDASFRESVCKQLAKLSKNEASFIAGLFQEKHLKPPRWFYWVPVLSFSSLLTFGLLVNRNFVPSNFRN